MKEIYCLGSKHQGRGSRFAWQRKTGHLLAVVGGDNSLHVYDKQGDHVDTVNLPGSCLSMEWDSEGSSLALITDVSSSVIIWDSAVKKTIRVETGLREGLSLLVWSPTSPLLGIGSSKGNLVLYDHGNRSKVPVIGKHTKRITHGCWNRTNSLLALTGDDKVVSLSNRDGDTVLEVPVKGDATKVRFVHFPRDGVSLDGVSVDGVSVDGRRGSVSVDGRRGRSENCVCVLVSSRSFMFIPVTGDQVTQVNVTEEKGAGPVLDYCLFKDKLLIGFLSGSFLVISISPDTFSHELHSFNSGSRGSISSFSISLPAMKLAVSSDNSVRVFTLTSDLTGQIDDVVKVEDETSLATVAFTEDGKMMAVSSTTSASLHVFLAQMAIIGASFDHRVTYSSSLTEITISEIVGGVEEVMSVIKTETEPSIVAVGPFHAASVMNNKAWFYSATDGHLVRTFEYVAIVTHLVMNGDFAAALFSDGRINLHTIEHAYESEFQSDRESKIIQEKGGKGTRITQVFLTNDFLIHSSTSGTIEHFFLEDWSTVNVYRHSHSIQVLSCDLTGMHVAFIDEQENLFLYDAVSDQVSCVESNDWTPRAVFWDKVTDEDGSPSGVFVVIDESDRIHTHSFVEETIQGPQVNYVSNMSLPSHHHPLVLLDGIFTCHMDTGKLTSFTLSSHDFSSNFDQWEELKRSSLLNSLKSTRYKDSIEICDRLKDSIEICDRLKDSIEKCRSKDSIEKCRLKDSSEEEVIKCYNLVARCALYNVRLDIAIEMYKRSGDIGMAYSLEHLSSVEEKNLLAGNIAMFLEKYDLAQDLFLASSRPEEALKMRQCLQDWEASLVLATRLAPLQVPFICRERALQLELFSNDYHDALDHYERAVINNGGQRSTLDLIHSGTSGGFEGATREEGAIREGGRSDKIRIHNEQCFAGIARNCIRVGNTRRGMELALKMKDKELHLECAAILESMKLFNDAATLYEVGADVEKAASLYIKIKNIDKVTELVDQIQNKSTLVEYARAQENHHKFRDAVQGYKKAGELVHVVRILLDELKNPSEAVQIVKEIKSVEGAKMVAKFFQRMGDMKSAIEFLVLSKCNDEAFQVASSTGQMETYSNVLLDYYKEKEREKKERRENGESDDGKKVRNEKGKKENGKSSDEIDSLISDFHSIALYYEQSKAPLLAGKFYCLSKNYKKGVKLLLSSIALQPENESEAIQTAIDFAAKSREESVIRSLIDFLIGDIDGLPKDFKYLFRLYMKLGHFKEAAKTALIISKEEQSSGNYRNAHSLLFEMSRELRKNEIPVPSEMSSTLMLLHTYLLAKTWIKVGDHLKGAQLLIRVSNNISNFPSHTVPILTSTVVECSRASFKKHAFEFATMLMKPENREKIDPKLKRKIETLVRKSAGVRRSSSHRSAEGPEDGDEGNDQTSPCPFCSKPLSVMELACPSCKNRLPFCIASGQHVTKHGLTQCPHCDFPAIQSHLERLITNSEPLCPMCQEKISPMDLRPKVDID